METRSCAATDRTTGIVRVSYTATASNRVAFWAVIRVHCSSVRPEMREGMISCTLLAKFVRNGAFRGAVSTESPPGAIFLVHCCSVQGGRLIEMQVRIQCGYEAEYVAAFLAGSVRGKVARGAPCAFQRLRLGGKALDGELARLVPRGGPNQRSDRRRQPAAGPRLPSRSAFAESPNSPLHHLPLRLPPVP